MTVHGVMYDIRHQTSAPRGSPLIDAGPRGFPPLKLMSGTSWFGELGRDFIEDRRIFDVES